MEHPRRATQRRPSGPRWSPLVRSPREWAPLVWSTALALLLLGPALGAGYVLSYDMVWVPDLALRQDFLGVGTALPRAVPSDAVVSVLDELVPGLLLQKLVLLGSLAGAGVGAARLVRDLATAPSHPVGLLAQGAAATLYVWNPFVVERLVLGHWPVLVGYAVQPWLILLARRHRREARLPAALLVLLPLGCLSAGAGLATALVAVVFGLGARARANLALGAAALAANAPWLVSGLLHLEGARSDARGAELFAGDGEGSLPGALTFLTLGGVWNSDVVPVTRTGPLGVVWLAVLLLVVGLGLRRWWGGTPRRDALALGAVWLVGYGVALVGWAAPSAVGWLVAAVPGGGLVRDGTRLLGLCAPLLVAVVAHGVERTRVLVPGGAGVVTAGAMALAPMAVMPDAAWGVSGRLSAVSFPASYAVARDAVGAGDGDVLVLPFTSYRAPAWNGDRKVLDPLGRFLRRDYVANDELFVSDVRVAGEDPRARAVQAALALATPEQRTARLRDLGLAYAVRDASAAGPDVALAGEEVARSGTLEVVRLGAPEIRRVPAGWWVAMAAAWGAWLLLGGLAAVLGWARGRSGRHRR